MKKLTAVLSVFVTLVLLGGHAQARTPGRVSLNLAHAPAKGSTEALVTIILFFNFRCYYGNYVLNAFNDIRREFPGVFRLYFKHHSINRYNQTALLAGQATMAAQAQGKFWEMAEILFRSRYNINAKNLETYAREIGMKVKPYKAAMRKGTYRTRLNREVAQSKRFLKGSNSCPTVWINGKMMSGYISSYRLKSMLRAAAQEVRGIRIRPLL